jgi:hypothetical protein
MEQCPSLKLASACQFEESSMGNKKEPEGSLNVYLFKTG